MCSPDKNSRSLCQIAKSIKHTIFRGSAEKQYVLDDFFGAHEFVITHKDPYSLYGSKNKINCKGIIATKFTYWQGVDFKIN